MKPSKNPNTPVVVPKQSSAYLAHRKGLCSPFLTVLAILGLAQVSARAAVNFLLNPGFELGTNGWTIVQPWVWTGPAYAVQSTNDTVQGSANKVTVEPDT